MTLRLPIPIIISLAIASSQAFQTPSLVGRSRAPLAVGRGILEMAEVDASTVFPAETANEDFLGNYEDLVMPGKEGHGYQLIFEDDESFRLYVTRRSATAVADSHDARQQARENIGFFLDRDVVGNVPETKRTASNVQAMMRDNIDFFSSHAVGTILDETVQDESQARMMAREHIGFFSTASAMRLPKDTPSDETEARIRARENIDFFTLKDIGQGYAFNKVDEARKLARNNIDFFSAAAKNVSEKAKDESKERTTARLNIGFFS